MNVQELIEKLMKIPNKNAEVKFSNKEVYANINSIVSHGTKVLLMPYTEKDNKQK